ncbi:MAG TPA: DUF1684 domain-containing protein [Thermoleophilaceae bacterium]|nr:DUF1684 domain-containing protein [Thermoleophilaceae bacterium]
MDELDLLEWKRYVFELYARVRHRSEPMAAWALWRRERERLFREHPQSPIPVDERPAYTGPHVFDYDPAWRLFAMVEAADEQRFELPSSDGETMSFRRFGVARAEQVELDLYWLESYGGGLFLPFADATSGDETYGAGRYILDTIKGADLGVSDGRLVLDFNFAYQPSCSYDVRWTCPLAPPANRLDIAVRAGERVRPPTA